MSNVDSEKSLRVILFKCTKERWRSRPIKFKARGRKIGYAKLLTGKVKIPTQSEVELAELGTSAEVQRIVELEELNENILIKILTEPKNALVKQYQKLFQMENCELEFRKDALTSIAKRAMARKTGAPASGH